MVYLIAFCKTEIPFILSIKILLFLNYFWQCFCSWLSQRLSLHSWKLHEGTEESPYLGTHQASLTLKPDPNTRSETEGKYTELLRHLFTEEEDGGSSAGRMLTWHTKSPKFSSNTV